MILLHLFVPKHRYSVFEQHLTLPIVRFVHYNIKLDISDVHSTEEEN